MDISPKTTLGVLLLVLTAILFFAGCTQPSPVTQTTPAPTATTAAPTLTPTANSNETMKAEIAAFAGTFASETDGSTLLAAFNEGPNSTAFAELLGQLKAFKESDPRIKYVYTLEQRDGTVRFIVDANYGMPDGSGYLEVYDDAPVELKTPVTAPIGAGPYTDKWGTFYSGYAPVDAGSNATVILIGVDVVA
ncbi:MAG TPA: hypothetical protein PKL26_04795 [Methanolinea sp.]|nr:hypothetical protein [Methanolinea sp.]